MNSLRRPWLPGLLPGVLLDNVLDAPPWAETFGGTPWPALNAWADDQAVHVEAELPGVPVEALEIGVLGDQLTLSGERPELREAGTSEVRRERPAGRFRRELRLPWEVAPEGVTAVLKDGVLSLTLPKAPALRPHKIEVRAAG